MPARHTACSYSRSRQTKGISYLKQDSPDGQKFSKGKLKVVINLPMVAAVWNLRLWTEAYAFNFSSYCSLQRVLMAPNKVIQQYDGVKNFITFLNLDDWKPAGLKASERRTGQFFQFGFMTKRTINSTLGQ